VRRGIHTPSIFSVRMLSTDTGTGDGAGSGETPAERRARGTLGYDGSSLLQLVGGGNRFDPSQLSRLTDEERRALRSGLNTH
jgi:hypothetical protein